MQAACSYPRRKFHTTKLYRQTQVVFIAIFLGVEALESICSIRRYDISALFVDVLAIFVLYASSALRSTLSCFFFSAAGTSYTVFALRLVMEILKSCFSHSCCRGQHTCFSDLKTRTIFVNNCYDRLFCGFL